jgi:hypothetical protein
MNFFLEFNHEILMTECREGGQNASIAYFYCLNILNNIQACDLRHCARPLISWGEEEQSYNKRGPSQKEIEGGSLLTCLMYQLLTTDLSIWNTTPHQRYSALS